MVLRLAVAVHQGSHVSLAIPADVENEQTCKKKKMNQFNEVDTHHKSVLYLFCCLFPSLFALHCGLLIDKTINHIGEKVPLAPKAKKKTTTNTENVCTADPVIKKTWMSSITNNND